MALSIESIQPLALLPFLTFAETVFLREASHGCRRHFKLADMMCVAKARLILYLSQEREDSLEMIEKMKEEGLLLTNSGVLAILVGTRAQYPCVLFDMIPANMAVGTRVPTLHTKFIVLTIRLSRQQMGLSRHAIITDPCRASCEKNTIQFVGGKMVIEISYRNTLSKIFTVQGVARSRKFDVISTTTKYAEMGFTFLPSAFTNYCSWGESPAALAIHDIIWGFGSVHRLRCHDNDCCIHLRRRNQAPNPAIAVMLRNAAL